MPDLPVILERALRSRPDLKKTDADILILEEAVVGARNILRPQLDLTSGVTWRGVDGLFGSSARDTLRGETPSVFGAINLTFPFGRRAARNQLQRAKLQLEQARVNRRAQVSTIIVEVRAAHRTLRTVMREIEATRGEVRAAQASLDGERLRLGRGSSTVLDVTRLEEDLTEAELRLLQARTDLEMARVEIERVSGNILRGLGIAFDDSLKARR